MLPDQPPVADTLQSEMRAEMGAEARRELDNMREAEREVQEAPFYLAALDADGEVLYDTEPAWERQVAEHDAELLNEQVEDGEFPEEVDRFEVRER